MNLVTSHLSRLATFSGRENRRPFWLWVLTVYIVQMILGIVVSVPLTMRMMTAMQPIMGQDQAYLNEHPEIASQVMMTAMVPFMRDILIFGAVVGLVHVALMAAAVVRRLHDTDRSGLWGLPVVVFQLGTLAGYAVIFPRVFGIFGNLGPNPDPAAVNAAMASIVPLFVGVWLLGMVGFVFMVILFIFLVLRGTVGPNRYGHDLLPPPPIYPPPQWQPAPPVQQWQQPPARIVPGPWDRPPPG